MEWKIVMTVLMRISAVTLFPSVPAVNFCAKPISDAYPACSSAPVSPSARTAKMRKTVIATVRLARENLLVNLPGHTGLHVSA